MLGGSLDLVRQYVYSVTGVMGLMIGGMVGSKQTCR